MAQDELRFPQERESALGRLDTAAGPAQKADVQLGFESRDLLADRRLDCSEIRGGAADATEFGGAHEVANLAKFHP
jgi:hypothetical protein